MTRNSAGLLLLLACSAFSLSAAELTLHYAGKLESVTVPEHSPLSAAYTSLHFSSDADWPSALITRTVPDKSLNTAQTALLQNLQRLKTQWQDNPALMQSIQQIMTLISQVSVAQRIPAKLDPDWVQLRSEFDLKLEGRYTLYLTPYRFNLQLAGLAGNQVLSIHEGYQLADYLADAHYQTGAEKDFVYLIAPDGQWRKMPIALWNRVNAEPAPGAMIFVGFNPASLPDDMSNLNEQIVSYLANRIPQ